MVAHSSARHAGKSSCSSLCRMPRHISRRALCFRSRSKATSVGGLFSLKAPSPTLRRPLVSPGFVGCCARSKPETNQGVPGTGQFDCGSVPYWKMDGAHATFRDGKIHRFNRRNRNCRVRGYLCAVGLERASLMTPKRPRDPDQLADKAGALT